MAETPSTPGSDAQGSADPQTVGVSPEASQENSAPESSSENSGPGASSADPEPEAQAAKPESEVSVASSAPEPNPAPAEAASSSPALEAPVSAEPASTPPAAAEPTPAVEPPLSVATTEAVAAPEPAPSPPAGVAATLSVPPLEGGESSGGEWELLVGRVQAWLGSGEPQRQWQRFRGPLKGFAILVGVILALRLYSTAVSTLDSIPVVSGLLELAGLAATIQFVLTRLVRSSERRQVIEQWRKRWQAFRGQG